MTKQNYDEMSILEKKYGPKGLVFLLSPCNQFGGQVRALRRNRSFDALERSVAKISTDMIPDLNFTKQEPGSPAEIKAFVAKYGMKSPVTEKLEVNGPNAHPLWVHLKASAPEGGLLALAGQDLKWNFCKFLLDKNGKTIKRYAPTDSPMSFENDIVSALNK